MKIDAPTAPGGHESRPVASFKAIIDAEPAKKK
jgi:hypothetical protein